MACLQAKTGVAATLSLASPAEEGESSKPPRPRSMPENKGPASQSTSVSKRERAAALRSKAPPKPKQRPRPKLIRHHSSGPISGESEMLGKTLAGRYQVEGVLGRGTMGVVYRCRHLVLDRSVAIKILKPDLAQEEEVLQRFMIEAKAASSIGSKHIVNVLDFGRLADGSSYLVMEQLNGQTLGDLLAASPLLPGEIVLSIALQIAEGLEAAHAVGVVHRDLKPDNVFLTETKPDEYFVTIVDFGIAKVQASQNKLTQQGTLVGTPHYMSPEQATASPADHRSDIYSLGVILFEMATGDVPFDGETPVSVLTQHVHEKPPDLKAILPEGRVLPAGVAPLIQKCLAKNPDRRYQSMADLRADLTAVMRGSEPEITIEPEPELEPPPTSQPGRGRPLFFVAIVLAVLLGAGWGTREYLTRASAPPTIVTVRAPEPKVQPPVAPPQHEPEGTKVVLMAFPADSHVYKGDEDLGIIPVNVYVKDGEKLELLVKRPGYWPRRLVVDGKRDRIVVGLKKYDSPANAADNADTEKGTRELGPATLDKDFPLEAPIEADTAIPTTSPEKAASSQAAAESAEATPAAPTPKARSTP